MGNRIPAEVLNDIFPRKLERRNIKREVYEKLKEMILSGKLKKGQKLVLGRFARSIDMSVQSIRLAFLQLEKDKLIVKKGKREPFIIGSHNFTSGRNRKRVKN